MLSLLRRSSPRTFLYKVQSIRSFSDFRYLKSHEYFNVSSNTVGISNIAVERLGDVVYVEMPEVGDEFEAGEVFGMVETVKAAEDVYMPVSGIIKEVNKEVEDSPEIVNSLSQGDAWFIKIEPTGEHNEDLLMSEEDYREYVATEEQS